MKRSELFFNAVLVPLDFIALIFAGVVAYFLRVSPLVQNVRPAVFTVELSFAHYMQLVVVVAAITVGIFALQGLYAMRIRRRSVEEFTRIFSGISMGVMGVIVWIFLSAELFQSRFILLSGYVLAILFVSSARYIMRRVQSTMLHQGYGAYRVLLVGNGLYEGKLADLLKQRLDFGYRVVGQVPVVRWSLLERYRRQGLDEVIMTDPTLPDEDHLTLLDFCDRYKVDYKYVPNLFETYATNFAFRELGGIPLVELVRTPLDGWGRITKRALDVVGALVGLLFLAPLLLVVAWFITLDSQGPVIYRQMRIGRYKQPFELYKFRSMQARYCLGLAYGGKAAEEFDRSLRAKLNERSQGPLFKMRDDPRVTRAGRILRRLRIDELPQLWNVLKGEMSLIGPRPHLPYEVDRYDRHHEKLFTIKPGMSGMAQVNGSSTLPFQEEAKMDIGYIEHWSLKLDLILLLKTFRILFTDRNAV